MFITSIRVNLYIRPGISCVHFSNETFYRTAGPSHQAWNHVLMFDFFRTCTANCGTSSIFMSQMAIRTDVSFGVSSFTQGIPFFIILSCFKQSVLGPSGLLVNICGNHFALLLQCNHRLEMFLFFFFFLVSPDFTTMLAKRGTVFVRGCIGYHFNGLLSQLLVALHLLVLFIAMRLTIEDAGYDRVGGDVTECIVCVSGYDPLTFSFLSFLIG